MNYRLTENKKVFNGETLFQIECIEDCKYAKAGELGGYIASYDNLADGAWVEKDVCVCDTSVVKGFVKGGFVARGSIVEGRVNGSVVHSFVDENSELDYVILIDSTLSNTKHKAEVVGLYLSVALIILSEIADSDIIGGVMITYSSVEDSTINWNDVESMNVRENYCVQEYVNEETWEIERVEYGRERFAEANEVSKREWEMNMDAVLNGREVQTGDEEADMYFNENNKNKLTTEKEAEALLKDVADMGEYYKCLFGEVLYGVLAEYMNSDYTDTEEYDESVDE